jgi:hypothetical protein
MSEQRNFLLFRGETGCETVVNADRMKFAQFRKNPFAEVTIVFDDETSIKVQSGGEAAHDAS